MTTKSPRYLRRQHRCRRAVAAVLVVTFAATAAACGGDDDADRPATADETGGAQQPADESAEEPTAAAPSEDSADEAPADQTVEPSPQTTDEAAAEPEELEHIALLSAAGTTPFLTLITNFMIAEGGIDAEHGLDAEIRQAASAQAAAALMSGDEHFSNSSFGATATSVARGLPLKIVIGSVLELPAAIVASTDVTSVADLAGRKVAVSALGNSSQIGVVSYAQYSGEVDPDDIEFVVSGGTPNSVQYVVGGLADAAWMTYDSAVQVTDEHDNLHILVTPEQMSAVSTIGAVTVVTEDYAREHPETITKLVAAYMDANRRLYESREAFYEAADTFLPDQYTRDQLDRIYDVMRPLYAVNGGMDAAVIQRSYDVWATYVDPEGAELAPFKTGEELVDPSFTAAALERLGFYEGTQDHADLAGH